MKKYISPAVLLWMLLGCVVPILAQQATDYGVKLIEPPTKLEAGQKITLRVAYQAPVDETMLHVEIQTQKGFMVIANHAHKVSGSNQAEVTLSVSKDSPDQDVRICGWLGSDWRNPFGPITQTPWMKLASLQTQKQQQEQKALAQQNVKDFQARHRIRQDRPIVGLYQSTTSPWPQTIAAGIAQRLEKNGYAVCQLDSDELISATLMQADVLPMLIVDDIATVPAAAQATIAAYCTSGGNLVALGGPAFSNLQFRSGDNWLTASQLLKKMETDTQAEVHPLALPEQSPGWNLSTGKQNGSAIQVLPRAQAPFNAGSIYRMNITLDSWCTFFAPDQTVTAGDTLTVFWAKGDAKATQLSVEWAERDGSRWIAVVELGTQWKRYVLPERAFVAWPSPKVKGRFGPGDRLHLENAVKLGFGLSHSHTSLANGQYTIDVGGVATMALPPAEAQNYTYALQTPYDVPVIEMVSPAYKFFPVTNMKTVATCREQAISATSVPTPVSTLGLYPRAQAAGINLQISTRYIPLLETIDSTGRPTAVAATLLVPSTGAPQSPATLSVPIQDPKFFAASQTQAWLTEVIGWMNRGVLLAEGGSEFYTSFGDEDMAVGATVLNRGSEAQSVQVTSTITDAGGKVIFRQAFSESVAPKNQQQMRANWKVPAEGKGVYHVTTTLEHNGHVIDRLSHEFRILAPVTHPQFVTTHDGQFWLQGKPWFIHGVNFWPQHSMARENQERYEHWLSPQSYDQASAARNLEDVKAMGFNTISISYHAIDGPRNLLDVMARAQEMGLKVNLSIANISGLNGSSGAPGKFNPQPVRDLITSTRLAGNDTLIAYDIAWEPYWGNHDMRKRLDAQWRDWINTKYGSVEKAQLVWKFEAPREKDLVINPLDAQIAGGKNGPAAAMVGDYNRFLSDLMQQAYGSARQSIREVDPNHAVSFRMRAAGDPGSPACVMFELAGLRNVVDIFEPEAYGLMSPSEEVVRRAAFTYQYARALNPNLPVIYSELGKSQWDRVRCESSSAVAEDVAKIYTYFYQTTLRAGGNGTIAWWFPGGYRCDERSDFGIINPDRSWRPVSHVMHDFAARMTAPRALPTPDVWIPIQLDPAQGVTGVYQDVQKDFWSAYEKGKLPGLKISQ